MPRNKYNEPEIDKIYGYWKVLSYSHYDNEHHWNVECTLCSNQEKRRAGQLALGRSKSCRTCSAMLREGNKRYPWKGHKEMSVQYLNGLKNRRREIPVEVNLQDLYDKWIEQNGKCVYSGIELKLASKKIKWKEATASIDRIDSSKGYIKGNIQWVHKRINTMKNDMSELEFLSWCMRVTNNCGI